VRPRTAYRRRTALAPRGEPRTGLNPAARAPARACPTSARGIAVCQNLPRTTIVLPEGVQQHGTPLPSIQAHILALLDLPADRYTRLASPPPKPLALLRE
jgi:hypothetical protein